MPQGDPSEVTVTGQRATLTFADAFDNALWFNSSTQPQVCQSIGYMACIITSPARASAIANAQGVLAAVSASILAPAIGIELLTAGAAEGIPLGFANAAQFQQACAELCSALSESGISDFTIGVRGSSITGTSFSGAPFSAASDIDFFVVGRQMTAFPINQYGLVYPSRLNAAFPAIAEWSSTWSSILGRGVSVGGFASVPAGTVLFVH